MNGEHRPIVITCGDPAGVGPEVAVSAWKALKDEIPLCILIDPDFLPKKFRFSSFRHSAHSEGIDLADSWLT